MNRLFKSLLALLVCATILLTLPMASLAQSSLSETAEDEQAAIEANPELTEAEKDQWEAWATEDAANPSDNSPEDSALLDELSAAVDATALAGDADATDLELNADLPANVTNILLLGVDNRSEELMTGRSDAVIICSINLDNGSVKLTSITRDTAVTIPGYKDQNRINVAFKFGSKDGDLAAGARLAMKTVNRNFQMNIEKYVLVNIHGLASIIDALGGVDMDMTSLEANRINYELRKEPMDKVKREKVKAVDGLQHLDGMQAVTFARIRGIDDDFARSERQRKLLATLMTQVMKDIDLNKLVKLIEVALPFGATNLSAADMMSLGMVVIGGEAVQHMQSGESVLEQLRLPLEGTWKYGGDASRSMVVFRTDARIRENIEAMQQFIYESTFVKE
ncbi:MAG: LCP family protein [Candidatus Limiplasma sp.]|nr:LCP family protein [Candidatus Limiplasma sp.]